MPHNTARSDYMATPVIRGAYFYIHEKRTKDGSKQPIPPEKQRHEFVGLVPKLHKEALQCANYKLFSDIAMQAIQRCADFGGQFPAGGNWPIQDGDDPSKLAKSPWRAGCWVVKFSANFPPKVCVMQNGQRIEIPAKRVGIQDMYKSGDYCVVSFNAFTYDDKAKGVKFNFDGVLFVGAGDPIGTAQRSVDQMFGGAGVMPAATGAPVPNVVAPTVQAPATPQTYAPPAAPMAIPQTPALPPIPAMAAPGMPPIPAMAAPGMPPIPGR